MVSFQASKQKSVFSPRQDKSSFFTQKQPELSKTVGPDGFASAIKREPVIIDKDLESQIYVTEFEEKYISKESKNFKIKTRKNQIMQRKNRIEEVKKNALKLTK